MKDVLTELINLLNYVLKENYIISRFKKRGLVPSLNSQMS